MLIFHEGLPGAGKTYEAVAKHLLPAVERGRTVVTNIDGFNDPQCLTACSELLAIPIHTISARIKYLNDDEVKEVWKYAEQNCLLIIDEVQNYWPVKKTKLGEEITEFISKHRHLGIDIICIGQDLRDTHNLWKRRIDRKVKFRKLDALGAVNRYQWIAYKAIGELKFEKTTEGIETYQKRYFDTYKSLVSDDANTEVYGDKRAVLWNSPFMRFVLAFVLIGGLFLPWYIYRQFQADTTSLVNTKTKENQDVKHDYKTNPDKPSPALPDTPKPPGEPTQKPEYHRSPGRDYIEVLADQYRARLGGVLSTGTKQEVIVEFRDESMRVKERLTLLALLHLGWTVRPYGITMAEIQKGDRIIFLSSWPVETLTGVSNEQNREVSEQPLNGKKANL